MSATCNFTLIGRLVGSPESKATRNGTAMSIVTISVPVNKYMTGGASRVEFVDYEFTAFGKTSEAINNLEEGALIVVSGDIDSRVFNRTGGGTGRAVNLTARDITVIAESEVPVEENQDFSDGF